VPEPKKPFRDRLTSSASGLAAEMRCRISRWLGAATGFSLPRERMVRDQLVCRGIRNTEILSAMRATPRHLFIPAELRFLAYGDCPLSIGYGATISQPFIVALMTELLEPAKAQHVLEVGTGSGYQAAILAQLVSWVDTIEIVPELVRLARRTLHKLRYANVTVHEGNGYLGLPERAPFDRIIVTAAPPLIPRTLIDQLEAGGRLVAPVGATWSQELVLLEKRVDGTLGCCAVAPVIFVPMVRSAA
jgi:protein-L-isoaspartate(D-aspartate) O-methyltransferase